MATINQLPAALTFNGVSGNPADLLFTLTLTDSNGHTIPWNQVTGYSVSIYDQYGTSFPNLAPVVSSPSNYQINVAWTASQTSTLGETQQPRMALSIFLDSAGPYTLVSGPINMIAQQYPNQATS